MITTSQLIRRLQELDPSGNQPVAVESFGEGLSYVIDRKDILRTTTKHILTIYGCEPVNQVQPPESHVPESTTEAWKNSELRGEFYELSRAYGRIEIANELTYQGKKWHPVTIYNVMHGHRSPGPELLQAIQDFVKNHSKNASF